MKEEKIHILKNCRVDGKSVKAGDVVETIHHKHLTEKGHASYKKPAPAELDPEEAEEEVSGTDEPAPTSGTDAPTAEKPPAKRVRKTAGK